MFQEVVLGLSSAAQRKKTKKCHHVTQQRESCDPGCPYSLQTCKQAGTYTHKHMHIQRAMSSYWRTHARPVQINSHAGFLSSC